MRHLTQLFVGLLTAGAVAVAASQAQQPQQDPQQPVIRSGINFVRVDVIVTDKKTGKPVTDLRPEDFEIVEEGEPQTVETFRLVDIDVPVVGEMADAAPVRSIDQQEREMQREDVRVIAILLDDYHVARGRDMAIREKLANFVLQLNARDLVAVLYPLTPVTDLVFTRNHEAVAEALMRFQGRKYDYLPRNIYEEKYAHYPAATVEMIRAQVSMSALRSLAIHLGSQREGRKTVLFVSEGMTYNLPPSIANPNDPNAPIGAGMPDPMGSAGYTPSATEFFRSVDMASDLTYVFDAANRANTSIYTIDPRGMAPSEFGIEHNVGLERDRAYLRETSDWLRILADETGGRAIVGRNDFLGGLRQMLQDSSSYYLIGYNSTRAPTDGKFHEIAVRVKRPGIAVRARKGYWALTEESVARAEAAAADGPAPGPPPDVNEALTALAAPARGRPAQTWIGTSRGDAGRTDVTIVWEAVEQPGQTIGAARLGVTASSAGGDLYFRGKGEAEPGAAGAPAGGTVTFSAAPGPVDLRVIIEGARGEILDTETRTIDVPDYSAAGIAIGTPRLFRARTARDIAALRAGAAARPTATREFSRRERLLLRFDAWGPGGAAPLVTARMLNMRGEPVTDLPAPEPAAGGGYEIDIPLAPYAPNDYLIELSSGEEGDAVRVLTAIRIG